VNPASELPPHAFARRLCASGRRRAWWASGREGRLRASDPGLEELAGFVEGCRGFDRHEAIFLQAAPETGALFGAFVHRTRRGQGQGGLRRWAYPRLADFLRDGLRLARAMGRKSALAGLWWGGAKGLIAVPPGDRDGDPGWRRALYAEYGRFVTSLRGCYVTAEDVGTGPDDLAEVFRHTRFATCLPARLGGSGNPSARTADGVVAAMEAALDELGLGSLDGKTVAMQGAGNVASFMIERLLERGVARIVASEICPERRDAALDLDASGRLEVRLAAPDDDAILAEPCDVLAPNALGGVLGPETVERVRARVVCGSANNPLEDDARDARLLALRGVAYVPDFLANRLGIVSCSNEQYGALPDDPALRRQLDPADADSIPALTRRVLREALDRGESTVAVANRLADARLEELHPIWGHRTHALIESLLRDRWETG
jgi:glutamate dehydrogenase (NAD(P)+)